MTPRPAQIRHRIDPGDVPATKAARRLHLTLDQFRAKLPRLLARGFPPPDPDTGNFGLEAIDEWRIDRDRRARNPQANGLTSGNSTDDDQDTIPDRIARL